MAIPATKPTGAKPTTITLTRGAAQLLISALSMPWTKKVDDLYRCGVILDVEVLNLPRAPDAKSEADVYRAWSDVEITLALSDRQRDTAKAAISHHIESGGFPAGRYTNRLLIQLGLAGEE